VVSQDDISLWREVGKARRMWRCGTPHVDGGGSSSFRSPALLKATQQLKHRNSSNVATQYSASTSKDQTTLNVLSLKSNQTLSVKTSVNHDTAALVKLQLQLQLDNMEDLANEHKKLSGKGSYKSSISEIDQLIRQLTTTRDAINTTPTSAPAHLVRLSQSSKKSFDVMNSNLREVSSSIKSYSKVLDKVCDQRGIAIKTLTKRLSNIPLKMTKVNN
jgi:hypothetical protein